MQNHWLTQHLTEYWFFLINTCYWRERDGSNIKKIQMNDVKCVRNFVKLDISSGQTQINFKAKRLFGFDAFVKENLGNGKYSHM